MSLRRRGNTRTGARIAAALTFAVALLGIVSSPASATASNSLAIGQSLGPDQTLTSPNGLMTLIMQGGDGNVVLYAPGMSPRWSTSTSGYVGSRLILNGDGNLVVYDAAGIPRWDAFSHGASGGATHLDLLDNGNLALYDAAGDVTWSSNTLYYPSSMAAPAALTAGQSLQSPNGRYKLTMQGDGNVVMFDGNTRMWNTGTYGNPGAHLDAQSDGNVVVYSAAGTPLTHTSTWGTRIPGSFQVNDDGNVVFYTADWSSMIWVSGWDQSGFVRAIPGATPDYGTLASGFAATGGAYGAYRVNSNGCTTLTAWIVGEHTDLVYGHGNGGQVAAKLVAANPGRGLAITHTPQPGAIFSTYDGSWGASGSSAGHTGYVVAVNGATVTVMDTLKNLGYPFARTWTLTWNPGQSVDFVVLGSHLR